MYGGKQLLQDWQVHIQIADVKCQGDETILNLVDIGSYWETLKK